MKIYNVIWKDRHVDTTATPFLDPDKAVAWAKEKAHKSCRYEEDFEEYDVKGWLYYAAYSCEGDCLYVTEHEVME